MKYIVRVCLNPDFAARMHSENKTIPMLMQKSLDKYIQELLSGNVTYMNFRAEDVSGAACYKKVMGTFESLYPGHSKAIEILITEDDGSERAGAMVDVYNHFIGNTELLKVCNTITSAMKFAKDKPFAESLKLMNYLVSVDSGFGFSSILRTCSTMFSKIGLYEDWKDSPLEYTIGKENTNGCTTVDSFIDAMWEDENNSQVVGIDISYFLDELMHDELRLFLKRLSRVQQCFIFFFRVPYLSEKALNAFKDVLSDMVELRLISLPPLNEMQLIEYADVRLRELGFEKISYRLYDTYIDRIRREKMDGRFYGLNTADKVINEMVWAKMSHDMDADLSGANIVTDRITEIDVVSIHDGPVDKLTGLEELEQLVGMGDIKTKIEEIVAQVLLSKQNDKLDNPSIHMRFVGAPGTGKTTVARIVGKIFKEKGILSKGGFFEYEASALIGEYIGQTAPKTRNICRDAYGSVLFLDEAYALNDGDIRNGYGKEAITTLIAEMENHRDDMVIIMAGYPDEMNKLMDVNPGLRSRMPFVLEFKNYDRKQLAELFMNMAKGAFEVEPDLEPAVREYMNGLSDEFLSSKEFANARFVRNLYERTWSKAAYRASGEGLTDIKLRKSDFESASQEKEFGERIAKKVNRVGF